MTQLISTAPKQLKALLVAVATPQQPPSKTHDYLEELAELARTLGVEPVGSVTQHLEAPHPKTFIGTGKVQEVQAYVQAAEADMVIFDDDLSPSQVRNLEANLKCRILDRSLLILEIFAMRARTAQAKVQVELAHYQYLLPRLTRMWTHLSRQRGGTGTRGGAGEKELETDRRIIQHKISLLRKKLHNIEQQSLTQRKSRDHFVRVAIVGYTNAGKSTLMNVLAKEDVYAENKLFATLDATVRKVVIQDIPFLLSDTVGFIRKLPHTLVECFKSTLDEVREADLLLHVVDICHPLFEEHIQVVYDTLQEIKADHIPSILVFNKIDLLPATEQDATSPHIPLATTASLESYQRSYEERFQCPVVWISASKNEGINRLRAIIHEYIKKKHEQIYPNYLKNEVY